LEYYDGDRFRGTFEIVNATTKEILPSEADKKDFPFEIDNKKEKLLLNASCATTRSKCIEIFNLAAYNPNWSQQLEPAINIIHRSLTHSIVETLKKDAKITNLENEIANL
jgi:hypothetical protein